MEDSQPSSIKQLRQYVKILNEVAVAASISKIPHTSGLAKADAFRETFKENMSHDDNERVQKAREAYTSAAKVASAEPEKREDEDKPKQTEDE